MTLEIDVAITSQILADDTGASATDLITNDGAVSLSGTVSGPSGTTVQVFDGSILLGAAALNGEGGWNFVTTLSAGSYALSAVATDGAGDTASSATAATITVETTPPSIAITSEILAGATGSSPADRITSTGEVTLSGTVAGAPGTAVQIFDGTTALGTATLNGQGGWSYTATLGDGTYLLQAAATDPAGNEATTFAPSFAVNLPETTTAFPLGVYVGIPDIDDPATQAEFVANLDNFDQLMGTTPSFMDTYIDASQPISAWENNNSWAANSWAATPALKDVIPVIALPLASTLDNADQDYQAFASGQYDSMLISMVQAWAADGYTTQYWRPGWEMNLNGTPTFGGDLGSQEQADWIAAFQQVSTVLHEAGAEYGVNVEVMWNPGTTPWGNGGNAVTNFYPGNQYVDVIGADVYSDFYPGSLYDFTTGQTDSSLAQWEANPANLIHYYNFPGADQWSNDSSEGHATSLQDLIELAQSTGKPLAIAETGAGNSNGGNDLEDNPVFVQWLSQTLQQSGVTVQFVNIWDDNSGSSNYQFSYADDDKPLEAAAWAQYFGAGSETDPPGAISNASSISSNTSGSTIAYALSNNSSEMLSLTSGTLNLSAGFTDLGGIVIAGASELELDGGTSTIAGLVSGSGTLAIAGGNTTFAPGASITAGYFAISGGTATIATVLTYAGAYSQDNGTLDIAGAKALILTGFANTLSGSTIDGSGVLLNQGLLGLYEVTVGGAAILRNGATGTIGQFGDLTLEDSAVVENHAGGGVYEIMDGGILSVGSGTSFMNAGNFISSSTSGTNVIAAPFTNKGTGIISVTSGALAFAAGLIDVGSVTIGETESLVLDAGTSTIAGLVSGNGSLIVAGGTAAFAAGASLTMARLQLSGGSVAIDSDLTYAGSYDQTAGTLDIASGEALILDGVLSGGTMAVDTIGNGTIGGSGVLLNRGVLEIEGGEVADSAILRNGAAGTVVQQGDLTLAGSATVENHVGGVYFLDGALIGEAGSGASFVNGGSFIAQDTASTIVAAFTNKSTGIISVTSDSVLTYSGSFYQDGGTIDLGAGAALILSSASGTGAVFQSGTIGGSGVLLNRGVLEIDGGDVADSAILRNGAAGTVVQQGDLTLADSATVENHVGGVYFLDGALIGEAGSGASFVNGGSFIAQDTASTIVAAFTNKSTGIISVTSDSVLTYSGSFYQDGGTIDLGAGAALMLSSVSGTGAVFQSGTIGGSGVLLNRGVLEIDGGDVADSAILRNGAAGTVVQQGDLTLQISARIQNHVGGSYALESASILSSGTGTSFVNAGNFISSGAGIDSITAGTISNSGTLTVSSGSLDLDGSVNNTGTLAAQGTSISITGALTGMGTDQLSSAATLTLGGAVANGQMVTFEPGATGRVVLSQAQNFAGTVAGLSQSDAIDLSNFLFSGDPMISTVAGTGAAGTTTAVTVKDGLQVVTLDLLNQIANQYPTSASAYQLSNDGKSTDPGTLFGLAHA